MGGAVGLISSLTGVGGGVFLAPTLIPLQWASPKQTAALSAPFILVLANSAVGLIGGILTGRFRPRISASMRWRRWAASPRGRRSA